MLFSTPLIIRCPRYFRKCLKRIDNKSKILYLTFDDGPTPKITEEVLNILEKYNAKASFFCLGKNAETYPNIIQKIYNTGHVIGNHTYSHANAIKVSNKKWFENVLKKSPVSEAKYFRPPYGHLLPWNYYKLNKYYKIVFWDVLTYDFRKDISITTIENIINKKVRNGSIIVFHDSNKAAPKMIPALIYTLELFTKKGYKFDHLP